MKSEDVLKLHNVKISAKILTELQTYQITDIAMKSNLAEVIWELATVKPQWVFMLSDGNISTDNKKFHCSTVAVKQDGEELGSIRTAYHRRKHCIGVSCRQLRSTLERGDTTFTIHTAKAVSTVKRLFTKRSLSDLIEEAHGKADRYINSAPSYIFRKVSNERDRLAPVVYKYLFGDGVGAAFRNFIVEQKEPTTMLESVDNYLKHTEELDIAKDIDREFKSQRTCLVITSDGKYIVQQKDTPHCVHTDETFPENLRGKLGLLKLVNDGQMVSDVGCRINESIFVLIP